VTRSLKKGPGTVHQRGHFGLRVGFRRALDELFAMMGFRGRICAFPNIGVDIPGAVPVPLASYSYSACRPSLPLGSSLVKYALGSGTLAAPLPTLASLFNLRHCAQRDSSDGQSGTPTEANSPLGETHPNQDCSS